MRTKKHFDGYQNLTAAFDWGKAIGRTRRINGAKMGNARGTFLRGELRQRFEAGLQKGYQLSKLGKEAA